MRQQQGVPQQSQQHRQIRPTEKGRALPLSQLQRSLLAAASFAGQHRSMSTAAHVSMVPCWACCCCAVPLGRSSGFMTGTHSSCSGDGLLCAFEVDAARHQPPQEFTKFAPDCMGFLSSTHFLQLPWQSLSACSLCKWQASKAHILVHVGARKDCVTERQELAHGLHGSRQAMS